MNLRPVDVENCDMGACAKSWFYTEWGNRVGVHMRHSNPHSFLTTEIVFVCYHLMVISTGWNWTFSFSLKAKTLQNLLWYCYLLVCSVESWYMSLERKKSKLSWPSCWQVFFPSTVLCWMWDGCTNPGSTLPHQPHQQSSSWGMWQWSTGWLSGLQQWPLWESHWVVHRPLESGMRRAGGYAGFKWKWSSMGEFTQAYHMFGIFCVAPVLCRVWSRQPAEVSGVFNEVRWRIDCHAAVWVLVPGSAPQPAELQPQGLWSKVVPHWLECCE